MLRNSWREHTKAGQKVTPRPVPQALASFLVHLGEHELVLRLWRAVLPSLDPAGAATAWLAIASALEARGDLSDACSAYDRALVGRKAGVRTADVVYRLAKILEHLDRPAAALARYKDAVLMYHAVGEGGGWARPRRWPAWRPVTRLRGRTTRRGGV
jgi:tetratricopeptide (TPR) repeat protein